MVYISSNTFLNLQEKFVHKVTKMIEMKKEDSQEVLKGWFTQEQMRVELKWSATLISIYAKKHQYNNNQPHISNKMQISG